MDAKKLIENALIDLSKEYSIDHITVQMILDKSTLGRTTFYRYFRDKYDVQEQIFLEKLQDIVESKDSLDGKVFYVRMLTLIQDNREFFYSFLTRFNGEAFDDFILKIVEKSIMRNFQHKEYFKNQEKYMKYALAYFTKGTYAVMKEYIMSGCKENIEDFAEFLVELSPTMR